MSQVLRQLPVVTNENLLVGLNTSDDAAVYKVNEHQALIHTVDFFTPVVDDPYVFGQIAACNALSDIYAMGGKPLLALNIVGIPEELAEDILPEILKGGADKVKETGAVVGGGHSIKCPEPIYGLSVLGEVHPDKIITNAGAKPGEVLILTKPLGTGIAATAFKADMLDDKLYKNMVDVMSSLNKLASQAAVSCSASSMTDITGFGLMGHANEMAEASNVSLRIKADKIPLISGVTELASMGMLPGGLYKNKKYLDGKVKVNVGVPENIADITFDPQTSGGLLISINEEKTSKLMEMLNVNSKTEARVIGKVEYRQDYNILLE